MQAVPRSALSVLFGKFYCVAHRENSFRRVVRNLATKFLLEGHDEFDCIEAAGAEIVDEAGFSVTLSGSTPRCSTMIFLTRSPISLIVPTHFSAQQIQFRSGSNRRTGEPVGLQNSPNYRSISQSLPLPVIRRQCLADIRVGNSEL